MGTMRRASYAHRPHQNSTASTNIVLREAVCCPKPLPSLICEPQSPRVAKGDPLVPGGHLI